MHLQDVKLKLRLHRRDYLKTHPPTLTVHKKLDGLVKGERFHRVLTYVDVSYYYSSMKQT